MEYKKVQEKVTNKTVVFLFSELGECYITAALNYQNKNAVLSILKKLKDSQKEYLHFDIRIPLDIRNEFRNTNFINFQIKHLGEVIEADLVSISRKTVEVVESFSSLPRKGNVKMISDFAVAAPSTYNAISTRLRESVPELKEQNVAIPKPTISNEKTEMKSEKLKSNNFNFSQYVCTEQDSGMVCSMSFATRFGM